MRREKRLIDSFLNDFRQSFSRGWIHTDFSWTNATIPVGLSIFLKNTSDVK